LAAGGFGDKTAARHQPADFRAFTIRAGRFFTTEDQAFELFAAFSALIFIDRHRNYSFEPFPIGIGIAIEIDFDWDPDSDFDPAEVKFF